MLRAISVPTAPGPGAPRMDVAVEHATVSLWPVHASPLRGGDLAAITARYRHGRAGIISGDTPPPAAGEPAPSAHPTVPVALFSSADRPDVPPQPVGEQGDEVPGFWSRLARRRSTPRGRHSPKD